MTAKAKSNRARDPKPSVQRELWARAAGRCEKCNIYLLHHPVTREDGVFGEVAHNLPASPNGPRAEYKYKAIDGSLDEDKLRAIGNLLLLCGPCHLVVDADGGKAFPPYILKNIKRRHEERIYRMTDYIPEGQQTTTFKFTWPIAGVMPSIEDGQMRQAVRPRIQKELTFQVECNTAELTDDALMVAGKAAIDEEVRRLNNQPAENAVSHLSLFAIGPIPLLVYLGSMLSDKLDTEIYQRHRDTENWVWHESGQPSRYLVERLRVGTQAKNVSLVLALSGPLGLEQLPARIDGSYSVYCITLDGEQANPNFLRLRASLAGFKAVYQEMLSRIVQEHHPSELHLFMATPAPVAVECGRALMKHHPQLCVYDLDKETKQYYQPLTVKKT